MSVPDDAPLNVWAADSIRQNMVSIDAVSYMLVRQSQGELAAHLEKSLERLSKIADALMKGERP